MNNDGFWLLFWFGSRSKFGIKALIFHLSEKINCKSQRPIPRSFKFTYFKRLSLLEHVRRPWLANRTVIIVVVVLCSGLSNFVSLLGHHLLQELLRLDRSLIRSDVFWEHIWCGFVFFQRFLLDDFFSFLLLSDELDLFLGALLARELVALA